LQQKTLEVTTPEGIENELHAWFNENIHLMDSYKHMINGGANNYIQLNRNEKLEVTSYKNLAIEH